MRRTICPSARPVRAQGHTSCKRTLAHSNASRMTVPSCSPRPILAPPRLPRISLSLRCIPMVFSRPLTHTSTHSLIRAVTRGYATSFSHDDVIRNIPNPRKSTSAKADFGWVSDNAGIVESRDQQTIDETIEKLHKNYGAEVAVVTLVSLPTSNSEEFREFATRLFNSWGIGNAQRDNGVLILLIRENRRFDVVTGTGLSTVLPPSWLDEFQNSELTGPLRRGDYSMALTKTVVAISDMIEDSERKWRREQPKPKEDGSESGFLQALTQLSVLLGAFAALLLWQWQREDTQDETRTCKFCGGTVTRDISRILSHTDAQAIEEQLGAVHYEVGSCSGCRRTQNIRHPHLLKGQVRKCDYCHYWTAIESESFYVDDSAQTRTRILKHDCRNCKHSAFTQEPVAYQSPSSNTDDNRASSSYSGSSSSSSSSGYGGGSSTGGGSGVRF